MGGPASRYVDVGSLKLHYADWGGDGPPLLFVHGDMRTSRSWDAVARDLRHRFRVLAVDCRGSGDSTWTDSGYRFSDRISDLSGFCDAIGLRDAVVVAHSTGGVVTTLIAHRSPGLFSRLVLLEPMIVVDEAFQRRVSRLPYRLAAPAAPYVAQPPPDARLPDTASRRRPLACGCHPRRG